MNQEKRETVQAGLLGLIAGVALVIYSAQHDNYVHSYILNMLKAVFKESYNADLQGNIYSCSLLDSCIQLTNVTVNPTGPNSQKPQWNWHTERMILKGSWLSFLITGHMPLQVSLHGVEATTECQHNIPTITQHLHRLIGSDTGYPIGMEALYLVGGIIKMYNAAQHLSVQSSFAGTATLQKGILDLDLYSGNALIQINEKDICSNLWMKLSINALTADLKSLAIAGHGGFTQTCVSHVPSQWNYNGSWSQEEGKIQITSEDQSCLLTLSPLRFCQDNLSATIRMSAKMDHNNQLMNFTHLPLTGLIRGKLNFCYNKNKTSLSGFLVGKKIGIGESKKGNILLKFRRNNNKINGSLQLRGEEKKEIIDCLWIYDLPQKFFTLLGKFEENSSQKEDEFKITAQIDELFLPQSIHYFSHPSFNEKPCLQINRTVPGTIEGFLDYNTLRPFLERYSGLKLPGTSSINFSLNYIHEGELWLDMWLKNGTIHVPTLYNFMRSFECNLRINYYEKMLTLTKASLSFEKGSATFLGGVILLDDNLNPKNIFIPCLIDKVFINNGKKLYASLSGDVALIRANNRSSVDGRLIIDRGYLHRNLFSSDLQKTLVSTITPSAYGEQDDIELQLELVTRNPIQVKTSFLKAAASVRFLLEGSFRNPSISGGVTIENGELLFPYRPLSIVSSHLTFLPNQLHDPLIELVAKGRVRSHLVTMRCQGSLQSPHIYFDSTPPLSQEQIITLLLAGSSEGALSLIMPSLIMQHIHTVIFGPEQSQSRLEHYFKSLFFPLRHIRFVPGFADQTARGGFRGAFHVEVNDQLRGVIKKNFSLPEDTKIEVEYDVSDDMTIRGIRDERGDLGGEIEMRWKF